MAYTKQVREYCLKNQGAVLDVSLVKEDEFSEIPYKTLLEILNRLEEEKLIFGISKGVYAIGKLNVQDEPTSCVSRKRRISHNISLSAVPAAAGLRKARRIRFPSFTSVKCENTFAVLCKHREPKE